MQGCEVGDKFGDLDDGVVAAGLQPVGDFGRSEGGELVVGVILDEGRTEAFSQRSGDGGLAPAGRSGDGDDSRAHDLVPAMTWKGISMSTVSMVTSANPSSARSSA